jgi:hypothetical protein
LDCLICVCCGTRFVHASLSHSALIEDVIV